MADEDIPEPEAGSSDGSEASGGGPEGLEDLPESMDPDDFTEEQLEELLTHETKSLPKHLRIAQAKYKSQKARAKMEEKKEEEGDGDDDEDDEPSEEEKRAERGRSFPDARQVLKGVPEAVERLSMQNNVPYVVAEPGHVIEVLSYAKRVLSYDHLACLTAADYDDRLEVVYNLHSYPNGRDLAVKVALPRDDPVVGTATDLWLGADWFEREVYDLFGVRFEGHPNLKRIMMPEGWDGFPLRKDYNITEEQYIGMDAQGNDTVSTTPEGGW